MTASTREAELAAARLLLERMGISLDDLIQAGPRAPMPTFAEYVPKVRVAVSAGLLKAYGTYWDKVVAAWGERRLDEPTPTEIEQLRGRVQSTVVARRNARGGRSAAEHLVAALRCLYRRAVLDGLIREADNPAAKVAKPRRLASTRQALADGRLVEINQVAASTGNDPQLDCLLLRLHTETACRRGGALGLRPRDLDPDQCLIFLREKGGTSRWQPVSPTLMRHLLQHHAERGGGDREGRLLRYRNGRPLTYRRYDNLWVRLGQHLPWVRTQQISTHWLRHTTLTWVERRFGTAIARAYAGHTDGSGSGSTALYVKASLAEVASALAALTGEAHPAAVDQ
ncbi:site-specific integrase [Actinoplanes sp. TBRC 11911]|uniref:tyrosine-type recombinase/integrase n=1 Tax=Actinoplanes sp. TBRC 11911 TaxID=2729386 RepID=UPI00145F0D34|nr:site-specific integrase [Actinoplanes sp. TBRC 11911]NMO50144.1 site-specific integrase [Actinoplanes sp. TBRC 11911]